MARGYLIGPTRRGNYLLREQINGKLKGRVKGETTMISSPYITLVDLFHQKANRVLKF